MTFILSKNELTVDSFDEGVFISEGLLGLVFQSVDDCDRRDARCLEKRELFEL